MLKSWALKSRRTGSISLLCTYKLRVLGTVIEQRNAHFPLLSNGERNGSITFFIKILGQIWIYRPFPGHLKPMEYIFLIDSPVYWTHMVNKAYFNTLVSWWATGAHSEKRIVRQFCSCTSIEYTSTNLAGVADYSPRLYGVAYCSWAVGSEHLHSMFLCWIL